MVQAERRPLHGMNALTSTCWCGSGRLGPFSTHYLRCLDCETLCLATMPDPDSLLVKDDDRDLYGKQYWDRVAEKYGFPKLEERARQELPERCTHWLRSLLRRKLPPGRVLELGCGHGAFVALMQAAGFEAMGLELSPASAEKARRRFDIPMLTGPLEEQAIAPGSLDAIVMMDVLEHLHRPAEMLRLCLSLLKADGILLLQTPRYPEGKVFRRMQEEDDPFLQQLKEEQHLYLFSRNSVKLLLRGVGAGSVEFEPAVFDHYDMLLAAGRGRLQDHRQQEVVEALTARPARRLPLALLDMQDARWVLQARLAELETKHGISRRRIALERLQRSLVYRTMRMMGLWEWLQAGIDEK
jgi:2-polyprenyl-3-methyl-5-hydroxy-6-metoxy-1,4-benzoquinol methylase